LIGDKLRKKKPKKSQEYKKPRFFTKKGFEQ